jgi:eukaryotic-like serine/threonine-protein kinase
MSLPADGSRISHYRVVAELGRDGLGSVLQAVDDMLDRPVALKLVRALEAYPAELASAMRGRFMQAAQRAARVVHPNVVTLYGYEQLGELDILSMELVEGDTLHARLARGERWAALDAAALVARVADGVAAAHARDVVHGNLRLRNVKLRPDGRVKILDLGVPKATGKEVTAQIAQTAGLEAATIPVPTVHQDVVALARMTCHLITGALRFAPGTAPGEAPPLAEPLFPEPRRVLANLGVLAPVVERGLRGADGGYAHAGEFRDALLRVVEAAGRPAAVETATDSAATVELPLPEGPEVGPRDRAILDAEGALSPLERYAADASRPALVLPADLANRARPPRAGTFVVMGEESPFGRVAGAATDLVGRLTEGRRRRVLIAASVLAVLAISALFARQLTSGDASAATVEEPAPTRPTAQLPAPPAPASAAAAASAGDPGSADPAAGAPASGAPMSGAVPPAGGGNSEPPVVDAPLISVPAARDEPPATRTAQVRATPAGTAISPVGMGGGPWLERVELSVQTGDSIVLRFVRPGYVARRAVFRGEPLAVALRPDSVTVNFETNVEADVYILAGGDAGERLLGAAPLTVQLPTGVHRITFRAPFQEDWGTTAAFQTAGETHTVQKLDYATSGDVVATVAGAWAWVSVDEGEEFETPHRFASLPLGRHILRLRRDGFRTIVDTVQVRGGQTLTKQYTLQR